MRSPHPAATGLYCELYWGQNLSEAWSFGPEQARIVAAPDEAAPLPLYGFRLPEEPFLLAEHVEGAYRIYPTPQMRVERRQARGRFEDAAASGAPRPYVTLGEGEVLRLSEGELSLHLHRSVVRERTRRIQPKQAAMIALGVIAFLSLPLGFLAFGPDPARQVEMAERALTQQRERDAAKRESLGVRGPARALTPQEIEALEADGGVVLLPNRITVEQ